MFTVCSDHLGIESSNIIPDENIQASGSFGNLHAWEERLNGAKFWAEKGNKVAPWIQADIGYQTSVSGVITQGDGKQVDKTPDWVTTLKVSTFKISTDDEEVFVKNVNGTVKVST